jgi:hypothetical protein
VRIASTVTNLACPTHTAASIPGTGPYERKCSRQSEGAVKAAVRANGTAEQRGNGAGFAVGIPLLAFMAGELVVFILMPHSIAPTVTPPATVSFPQSRAPSAAVERRRAHRSVGGAAKSAAAPHVLNGIASEEQQASPAPTTDAVPPTN